MSVKSGSEDDSRIESDKTKANADDATVLDTKDARRVQRKAIARQSTRREDDQAAVPNEKTMEGDEQFFDRLFDENGMAFDSWWEWKSFDDDPLWEDSYNPGEKRRSPVTDPRSVSSDEKVDPDEDPEAFLEAVAPDLLADLNEKFGDTPGTRAELIRMKANKLADEKSDEELPSQSDSLVITEHQDEREDIWAAVDQDEEEQDGEECPECGSTNTSSYQQQTGGADEGMTSFHKCGECGHSWRGGYAG